MKKSIEHNKNLLEELNLIKTDIVLHLLMSKYKINPYTQKALINLNLVVKKKIINDRKNQDFTIEKIKKVKETINKVYPTESNGNPRLNAHQSSPKNKEDRPNKVDVNDYPTPQLFVDIIINGIVEREIFGGTKEFEFIDLCCSEENKKFEKGLTLNGPTGFDEMEIFFNDELKPDRDSLDHNWNKLSSFGWIASPYKKKEGDPKNYGMQGVQGSFAEKAFIESNKGMKIVALFQDTCGSSKWFHKFIYTNRNCEFFFLEGRLKYPEMYYGSPNYGNLLVFFGVERNSISNDDFEYFRTSILQYDEMTKDDRRRMRREHKKDIKNQKENEINSFSDDIQYEDTRILM